VRGARLLTDVLLQRFGDEARESLEPVTESAPVQETLFGKGTEKI
jgi:hypothetical protein